VDRIGTLIVGHGPEDGGGSQHEMSLDVFEVMEMKKSAEDEWMP
jgi:hypothetical protein